MAFPKEVTEHINILYDYAINEHLKSFHILHMYPKEIAYPNGYYDSRFAEVIGFNCDLMEKRNLGKRDGVDFWMADKNVEIMMIRIFADGSTMIKFFTPVTYVSLTQAITFIPVSCVI